jgi:hypothetical protein
MIDQPAFLMGDYSISGWRYYFPVAFLIKASIPFLVLLTISLIRLRQLEKEGKKKVLFLLLPAGIIFLLAVLSRINTGVRYILPIFPFLIVLASSSVFWFRGWKKIFLAGLIFWQILGAIRIYPDYLAYFNEFIGGSSQGYRYLADSNLDWGQDLKRLASFIREKNLVMKINVFGVLGPELYGIDYDWFGPSWLKEDRRRQLSCSPVFGWLAISTNQLQAVYLDDKGCFDWLKKLRPERRIGYSIFVYNYEQ